MDTAEPTGESELAGEPENLGEASGGVTRYRTPEERRRRICVQCGGCLSLLGLVLVFWIMSCATLAQERQSVQQPVRLPQVPIYYTGVGRNIRRDLIKTPSRRHFESKRTSKTGSTSKIGSRNGFVRFGNFCIFRSLSPHGVLNSGHKLTVTYYGEITIEPILNPEFDVDHDFEVKNGCFQSLFPRFRVISVYSTGRASHSDHFSGQVSMATILQDFYLFRRGFQLGTRDHLPDEG